VCRVTERIKLIFFLLLQSRAVLGHGSQMAYGPVVCLMDLFAQAISSYLNNFKLVRLSHNRAKDKIWITPGLKRSSKHKNKFYKKWLKSKLPSDEEKYKTYRRLCKQLLKETKKVYYRD